MCVCVCVCVCMGLLVYADDLVLTGNDSKACVDFKEYLNSYFHIKDLGSSNILLELRWHKTQKACSYAKESML